MPVSVDHFRLRAGPLLLSLVLAAGLLTACSGDDSRTTITFFQFKPEAQAYFRDLARQFEKANPDVRIVVDNPAEPETALRTRLVKNDVPDVMSLNANSAFGEWATAKIFRDFRNEPVLDNINPAYQTIIKNLGQGTRGEINGVPFAANASGLLYNEQLFAQHRVAVPKTFDELIAAAEKFKAAGVTPFYGMLADAWTAQSPLAPLTAQTQGENFFQDRFAGRTDFATGWRTAMTKLERLFDFTQPDPLSKGYEDGTTAFAGGKIAMLLLGSYAIPQIRNSKPKFEIGSIALPATNDPSKTTLVSGVDVVLTASRNGAHPEESQRFIEFLMGEKVVSDYCKAQVAVPTLKGLTNNDPALAGVQPYVTSGRIVGFTDHQIILAIPLGPLLQEFLIHRKVDTFLRDLDDAWDRVAKRRTWGLGAVTSG